MGFREDVETLRQNLDDLAGHSDAELTRYEINRPAMPPGIYWQLRWLAGWILRWLERMHLKQRDPWPAALRQHSGSTRAQPLLIWAVGADSATLRTACRSFAKMQADWPGFAPVLVTDIADFALFSRLGWLVEYLPTLSGEGQSYEDRKARFLARLYRGALALPVSAALDSNSHENIRRYLASGSCT